MSSIFLNRRGELAGWSDHIFPQIIGGAVWVSIFLNFILFVFFTPVITYILWDKKDRVGVLYKYNWIPYLILNIICISLWIWIIFGNALEPTEIYNNTPYKQWDFTNHPIK